MCTVFLGLRRLHESHTGEYIATMLRSICNEWEIEREKVVTVTVDLGANIGLAVKLAFGEDKIIYCFAHTLNLVAQKSIGLYSKLTTASSDPVIDEEEEMIMLDHEEAEGVQPDEGLLESKPLVDLLNRTKAVIRFIKKSEVAGRHLLQLQMEEGNKKESECHSLILDVRTRWNSIYLMVERFVALAPHVAQVMLAISRGPPMLGGHDLAVLREVTKVLKPLFDATENMSGEKYVTASMAIPVVRLLNMVIKFYFYFLLLYLCFTVY